MRSSENQMCFRSEKKNKKCFDLNKFACKVCLVIKVVCPHCSSVSSSKGISEHKKTQNDSYTVTHVCKKCCWLVKR